MASFLVCYRMVASGSVTVKADDVAQAEKKVENMPLSELGAEAEDGEVEIVSTADAEDDKTPENPEEALETYEDEIGLTYALDEGEPTKHMRDLWEEAPCYLQVVPEGDSKILVASKAPLKPEQVARWLELRKAAVDAEMD